MKRILKHVTRATVMGGFAVWVLPACAPQAPGSITKLGLASGSLNGSPNDSPYEPSGIIGGTDATGDEEFSKTVAALYNTSRGSLCTASILSETVLLSAAHCIDGAEATDLVAIFNTDLRGDNLIARRVQLAAVSELWETNQDLEQDTGDIALVKFAGGLPKGFHPASILSERELLTDGEDVLLAGYGINNGPKRTGSKVLRFVTTQMKNKAFSKTEVLLDQTQGRGACHGDSGGPAYVKVDGKLKLFGVTSRGVEDPDNDCSKFSAYTNVLAYGDWIAKTVETFNLSGPRPQPIPLGPAERFAQIKVSNAS